MHTSRVKSNPTWAANSFAKGRNQFPRNTGILNTIILATRCHNKDKGLSKWFVKRIMKQTVWWNYQKGDITSEAHFRQNTINIFLLTIKFAGFIHHKKVLNANKEGLKCVVERSKGSIWKPSTYLAGLLFATWSETLTCCFGKPAFCLRLPFPACNAWWKAWWNKTQKVAGEIHSSRFECQQRRFTIPGVKHWSNGWSIPRPSSFLWQTFVLLVIWSERL